MPDHEPIEVLGGYNFSSHGHQLRAPASLVKLSLESMSGLAGEDLVITPSPDDLQTALEMEEQPEITLDSLGSAKLIPLRPLRAEAVVVGVDASSLKVGETSSGIIVALRGAIVWRSGGSCRYLRVGPLLFHVTEENKDRIYNTLRRICLGLSSDKSAPNLIYMPVRMANIFEHWLREMACHMFSSALLLLDGSLTVVPDGIGPALVRLLELARSSSNVVIAISKTSRLRVMGRRLLDLLNGLPGPCLLELDGDLLARARGIRFLGRVYVAKLSALGYPFRMDVDARLPRETCIDAIRMLMTCDALYQGYPEVLRLAHIMATFTAPEVMAMQLMLSRAYGLKVVQRPDVRKLLFGPFGVGGRAS